MTRLLAAPTGRAAVCERIFDAVRDDLGQEVLDEQAERASGRQPTSD